MLTPTHQAIKQQVQSASLIHADETRHQRGGERRWMWMALSKIAVCFMTAYGRGTDAAKRLLGSELTGVLVTDQYVAYRFIDASQRQLCWAHVLRNVVAIAQSGEQVNQFVGARLVLLANSVFRARHRYEDGDLDKARYLRRLRRDRQSWLTQLQQEGVMLCTKRYRGRCEWLIKDDEMLWRKGSYGVCSHRGELFRQRILSLVEAAKRLGCCAQEWLRAVVRTCIEKADYPLPCRVVYVKPLPVNGYLPGL